MKLLLIRPAALGDSLMLMPSLNALRGTAETVLVGRRPGIDFLAPYARQAMDYESQGWHLLYARESDGVPALPLPSIDLAVLFHADPEGEMASRLKAFLPGAEVRVFPGFPPEHTQIHAALHLAACIEAAGCPINATQAYEHALRVPLLSQDAFAKRPENAELPLRAQGSNPVRSTVPRETRDLLLIQKDPSIHLRRPQDDLQCKSDCHACLPPLEGRFAPRNDGTGLLNRASNQSVLEKDIRRIIIHPGSGSARKNHPPEFWLDFAAHLSASHPFPLTVLLGPAEEALLPFFKNRLQTPGREILFCPERKALLSALSQAALYAGQDSGITHLAAMVGAPTLALFRSSSVARWRPLGPGVRIIAHEQSGLVLLDEALANAEELLGQSLEVP